MPLPMDAAHVSYYVESTPSPREGRRAMRVGVGGAAWRLDSRDPMPFLCQPETSWIAHSASLTSHIHHRPRQWCEGSHLTGMLPPHEASRSPPSRSSHLWTRASGQVDVLSNVHL